MELDVNSRNQEKDVVYYQRMHSFGTSGGENLWDSWLSE